jgi:hypothetical protein
MSKWLDELDTGIKPKKLFDGGWLDGLDTDPPPKPGPYISNLLQNQPQEFKPTPNIPVHPVNKGYKSKQVPGVLGSMTTVYENPDSGEVVQTDRDIEKQQASMDMRGDADRVFNDLNPLTFAGSGAFYGASNIAQGNIVEGVLEAGLTSPLIPRAVNYTGKQIGKYLKPNTSKQLPSSPNAVSSVDDVGKNFKSEIDWAKWNKKIPENKALMQSSNELPPPPHELIFDGHTINLERLAPKNKRKMMSFDDSDIGGGLTLRNNPSRVKNTEDILGTKRSIKSVMDKKTGESIDLKTWKDDDGKLYYYMSANMPSSKIKAGKAYLEIEKHIPKGASLLENSSLSYDSFLNILKQTKNPKFETFVKGKIPMNNNAKTNILKIQGDSNLGSNYYKSESLAKDATNELNTLLNKYNLPEATVNPVKTSSGRVQMYEIQLPNIGLKKLYSIIGIGGAGALGAASQIEQKQMGGWLNKYN